MRDSPRGGFGGLLPEVTFVLSPRPYPQTRLPVLCLFLRRLGVDPGMGLGSPGLS